MTAASAPTVAGRARGAGPLADLGTAIRALAFVEWRAWLWRLRQIRRNLIGAVLLVAAVALFTIVQVAVLSSGVTAEPVDVRMRTTFVLAVSIMLTLGTMSAVRVCPVRMRGADVAWMVPRPQGPRALVAWHVVVLGTRAALIGGVGITVAALIARSTPRWQPVVAIAAGMMLVQAVPTLTHLLAVHGGRLVRAVLQVGVPLWWASVAASAWASSSDTDWAPRVVHAVARPARTLLEVLVGGVVAPGQGSGLLWAVTVVVAATLVAVWLGTGYEDGAAQRTWEVEALRSATKDGSLTGEVMAEAVAKQVTRGIGSLEHSFGLHGEWALVWATLATLRRTWRSQMRVLLVLLAVAVALAAFAPSWAGIPAAFGLLVTVLSLPIEAATQRSRLAPYVIPGSPARKLVALDAGSVVPTVLSVVVTAVPWAVVSGLPWTTLTGLLVVLVAGLVALTAVSGVVALWASSIARQFWLGVLGTVLVLGAMLGVGLAMSFAGAPLVLGAAAAGVAIAVLAWSAGARLLARGRAA